ncbi:trypsin-like peptidase domain-containing protein [Micromonospora sp. RTP1Z1]|uniref:trypsin-like peptidase domain-containing protein n=1 Tax=Micromonospora sp. RTP1Z1 TaxID=2994043 RepID=UPI0029C83CF4|nr:trypsin-like peptidase domain-containing protein [Micromonospora sp. RTP1Z1]
MTAGYGSGDGTPGHGADEATEVGRAERSDDGRPGPLPPRFEPHRPVVPGHPPAVPSPPAVPGPRAGWSPPPNSGQLGSPTDAGPAAPGALRGPGGWPPAEPVPGQPPGAEAGFPGAFAGQSTAGPGYPAGQPVPVPAYPGGQPFSGPAYPGGPAGWPVPAARPERRRRLPVVALALAVVLALVAGVQAYQLHRLDDRLAATDRRLADAQGADGSRMDDLEKRAEALEKQAGAAFNPEAVASAVLPSVFRVRAGQFTGTAFAIGKPAAGGTTLLTNFHVVESVFDGGGRKVFLERTDQRFEATIVKVDKAKDLAQLRTTAKFSGLVAAATPVKSGQQIVVVGAPLGLQDSVTTGVVSAFRKDEGGSGPVIQFDAPINPGNSGGPVINGSKEVVGIATAKARDAEGIGLAVPIRTACDTFKLC